MKISSSIPILPSHQTLTMSHLKSLTVLERSQSIFEGFINAGTATKSWFAIFSLLQRLRQACDHVSLTVGNMTDTNELTHVKCEDERSKVEPPSNGDATGAVDDKVRSVVNNGIMFESTLTRNCLARCQFLQNLLMKFKKNSNEVGPLANDKSAFMNHVAESLSQCVKTSGEFLDSECPICLDVPRVENAVHSELDPCMDH